MKITRRTAWGRYVIEQRMRVCDDRGVLADGHDDDSSLQKCRWVRWGSLRSIGGVGHTAHYDNNPKKPLRLYGVIAIGIDGRSDIITLGRLVDHTAIPYYIPFTYEEFEEFTKQRAAKPHRPRLTPKRSASRSRQG